MTSLRGGVHLIVAADLTRAFARVRPLNSHTVRRHWKMRSLEELVDRDEPALPLVEQWIADAAQHGEMLPPSPSRAEVLLDLQVTTRSPLGGPASRSLHPASRLLHECAGTTVVA